MPRERYVFKGTVKEMMIYEVEDSVVTDDGVKAAESIFTDRLRKGPETFVGVPTLVSREEIAD